MLKNGKTGNHNGQQNRKTEVFQCKTDQKTNLKNSQTRKTENPNALLFNEFATRVHNCDANAFCNNTDGSFNCACSPAHTGNATSCIGKSSCHVI